MVVRLASSGLWRAILGRAGRFSPNPISLAHGLIPSSRASEVQTSVMWTGLPSKSSAGNCARLSSSRSPVSVLPIVTWPGCGAGTARAALLVQESCFGRQQPPSAFPGTNGAFGAWARSSGSTSSVRDPIRAALSAVLFGDLVGQGPQRHVQAGRAAWLGRRQLSLRRRRFRCDGDCLAGLAAAALQCPAQRQGSGNGGREERASAEDDAQGQRAARFRRRRSLGCRGGMVRGGETLLPGSAVTDADADAEGEASSSRPGRSLGRLVDGAGAGDSASGAAVRPGRGA